MRHTFVGLLLICVVFKTAANQFELRRFYLRPPLTTAATKYALTEVFFDRTPNSSPSTHAERTPSVPLRATKTVSFPTRYEDDAADASSAFQTRGTTEKERLSVAKRSRSEGRSLRQDDGLNDEALTSEAPAIYVTERFLDASSLGLGRPSLFAEQTNS